MNLDQYKSQIHLPQPQSRKGDNGKLLIIGGSSLFHAASAWSLDIASRMVDMVFYSSLPENNELIKEAKKKSRIPKNIHPHTLRHSFATHVIQNGYAVTELQPLLGHSKVETTMIYVHMASPNLLSVKSPYDGLGIKHENRTTSV